MVREYVVRALVDAALNGMQGEAKRQLASVDEVGSASMTIALRTVVALKNCGCDLTRLRAAVERQLVECADDRVSN